MSLFEQLSEQLSESHAAPFLFVGSGLSRRYLGLETWEDLLRRFCEFLPMPYEFYKSKADGDLPKVASLMASDFHPIWWESEQFRESREEYAGQVHALDSCLKTEIAKYISSKKYSPGASEKLDSEIESLRSINVDGVITTNWDRFLEGVFREFQVYVGQEEILASHPQGIAEIFKIHGCCSKPSSLVLTRADYDSFDEKNAYLTAKLLTIFVEHPVVFLGYSLSDRNIEQLLRQLTLCLSDRYLDRLHDKLIIVEWEPDASKESLVRTVVKPNHHSVPVTLIRTDDFKSVYNALGAVKRKLPAHLLRNIKEHIYDLVLTNDPADQMYVLDIEKAGDRKDIHVVYGLGAVTKIGRVGYSAIGADDLCRDVLNEQTRYDPERIVQEVLPKLLKGNRKNVPVFLYLNEGGYLAPDGTLLREVPERVSKVLSVALDQSYYYPPKQYHRKKKGVQSTYNGVADLAEKIDDCQKAVLFIPFLPENKLDIDELKDFILANMDLMDSKISLTRTYIRRLICLYDWLVHHRALAATVNSEVA